uniref:E3 ubiquitin-protein ligase TRIM37 n=1 Tax=Culex pipiens TaxID=7175 RepID=A0A8D8MJ29_CULPI
MQSSGSDINRLCECGICYEGLQDAHICSQCSNPFCHKCIAQWLDQHHDCPVCRKHLSKQKLVKARIYEQVLEYAEVATKGTNCTKHRCQELSLFCWTCMECACVTCLFSKTHAKHKEQVVLFECASKKLKTRVSNELGWIIRRDQEIDQAIGLHGDNVMKLSAEKNRIFANIQQVLDAVKGQFDKECAKQQDKINLLEADKKSNSELRGTAEEWIKSEKIFELLPKIAALLKQNRFNSTLTKPKPVEKVNPNFKNDLIPELIQLSLPVDGREISQIFKVDGGFEFKLQINPDGATFYKVALTIEKGIGGVYLVSLGSNPPAPIKFAVRQASPLGRVNTGADAVPSVTVNVQLAKTYAEKCVQLQRYVHQLEQFGNSLKVAGQEQLAANAALSAKCNDQEAQIQELVQVRNKLKTLCQNHQVRNALLESGVYELSESLRFQNGQLQERERLLTATRMEKSALENDLLQKTHDFNEKCVANSDLENRLRKKTLEFDRLKCEANQKQGALENQLLQQRRDLSAKSAEYSALNDQLLQKMRDFKALKRESIKKLGALVIVIICLGWYVFK